MSKKEKTEYNGGTSFFEQYSSGDHFLLVWRSEDPESYVSRRHHHRAVEIGFMIKGEADYISNEQVEHIATGDMAYLDSWDVHYFDVHEGNETITMLIGLEYLQDFYKIYGESQMAPCFDHALHDKEVNQRIYKILDKWEKEFDQENILINRGYVNLILGELAKGYPVRLRKRDKQEMSLVSSMLEYINENYHKNITLGEVAEHIGYAVSYCSKLFHNYIDQDFRNYVNGVRVEAACRMMYEKPGKQIAEVAFACGFNSLNTFYRAYRRVYKNSPKRIAKLDGKGNDVR